MKKTLIIFLITFVSSIVQAQMENPLKEGMPNTVTLSSGEVVYELNGEWDAVFDNDYLGGSKSVVKITQDGNKFIGIALIENQNIEKNKEIFNGELEKSGFKTFNRYVYMLDDLKPSSAKIIDGGNKILEELKTEKHNLTLKMTLTRK